MSSPESVRFLESLHKLQGAADELRRMAEPDVDRVLEILDQVDAPAKHCLARIELLKKRLESVQPAGGGDEA